MKKFLILIGVVALIAGCNFPGISSNNNQIACDAMAKLCPDGSAVGRTGPNCEFAPCPVSKLDAKNGTYLFDSKAVTLKDGYNKTVIVPGSDSEEITRYFGNAVTADFNGDGLEDQAFLLTRENGGSGTFFYVAALLGDGKAGQGTNALLFGDRIAPQTTEFNNGMINVNFAERKPGEPFTTQPSVGVSKYFKVIDGSLIEVMPTLTEAQAQAIAEKTCIKGGEALSACTYNENSKTWWFDANLNATREGCNPACVVSEDTKTAEINWRCTGLIVPKDGTVSGKILLGPTCPVMKNPPDPACADKPYQTTIQIIENNSPQSAPYKVIQSDVEGNYSVTLPAGEYNFQPAGGSVMPRCTSQDVTVTAGDNLTVDFSCDSGIR